MQTERTVRNWLIVGCGYIGEAVARRALDTKAADAVYGVCRRQRPQAQAWHALVADVTKATWDEVLPPVQFSHVVFCAAPGPSQSYDALYVDGLQHVIAGLRRHQTSAPRLLYTSSSGVYDACQGEEVDEASPTSGLTPRTQTLRSAEKLVQASGMPHSVLRLGGIYGPGRMRLEALARKDPLVLREHPHWTNHIHQQDAADAIIFVAQLAAPEACYVVVDDTPVEHNALLIALGLVLHNPSAQGLVPPLGAASGKRCKNTRLKSAGFRCAHLSYLSFVAHSFKT